MNSAATYYVNTSPKQHSPLRRHGSADSFGKMYDERENAMLIGLALSVQEDEDDESVATSFSECVEDDEESEKSSDMDVKDDDHLHQEHTRSPSLYSSLKQSSKAVSFGSVSVCEFQRKDAPMLVSPKKSIHSKHVRSRTIDLEEYCRMRQPSPLTPNHHKPHLTITLSEVQFAQLQIPDLSSSENNRAKEGDLLLDIRPRLPIRSCDNAKAA